MLSKRGGRPGIDACVCGCFGFVTLWINALAVPVVAVDVGTWLLVIAVVCQLVGTICGEWVRFDACSGMSAIGAILLGLGFIAIGTVVFSLGYGMLYRRYLCSVWAPVRAAQYEFVGQILISFIAIPIVYIHESYSALFFIAAVLLITSGICADTEMRPIESMSGGYRVLVSYGMVCGGIGAFSLGGILLVDNDPSDEYSSYQSVAIVVGASLSGAFVGAIVSGIAGRYPERLFKAGALLASAIAILSLVINSIVGYCVMSAAFGFSTSVLIINSRAVCFSASSAGYIFIQKTADLIPPALLYFGLSFRQLLQTAPSFLSLALLILPACI